MTARRPLRVHRVRAFTLLELIVVVVILGVLATLAVPAYARVRDESGYKVLEQSAAAFARDVEANEALQGRHGLPDAGSVATAVSETPAHVTVDDSAYASDAQVQFTQDGRSVCATFDAAGGYSLARSACGSAAPGPAVWTVTTVAGVAGSTGYADGPATTAQFGGTWGGSMFMTADPTGNIFMADSGNQRIRRLAAGSHSVSTLAGDGTWGYADGPAASAQFQSPRGIVYSGGYLYVSDYDGNRIRRVDAATGAVTTLAGDGSSGSADGPVATASFNRPAGLAVDGAGDVYVADSFNGAIRKIDVSAGTVATLAGDGTWGYADGPAGVARFFFPEGLAVDGAGDVYVADANNYRIRKIDVSSGVVTTLAGNGVYGYQDGPGANAMFGPPGGLALAGTTLYVADRGQNTVRTVDLSTGDVGSIAGSPWGSGLVDGVGAAASLPYLQAIAVTPGGVLYIDSFADGVVRTVTRS